jgi:hypothetical protein
LQHGDRIRLAEGAVEFQFLTDSTADQCDREIATPTDQRRITPALFSLVYVLRGSRSQIKLFLRTCPWTTLLKREQATPEASALEHHDDVQVTA